MRLWGKLVRAIGARIFPDVPDAIRPALQKTRAVDINRHIPMLMAVAALNVVIIMAVCAHLGFRLASYGWMASLVVYCVVRIIMRRFGKTNNAGRLTLVTKNAIMSVVMVAVISIAASYTFIDATFNRETMIPVSLVLGTMAIAHCLYTLRVAAMLSLIIGIFPVSVSMILTGDFRAAMLGASFLSVAVLMIRFVAAQSEQLIQNLMLEHQIRELANTDVLTGLSNRRAIMEKLESLEGEGSAFGIALIDLDGFKQINDTLGHQAGDVLLKNVASRLSSGTGPNDLVGRLGGDEFIVILPDAQDDAAIAANSTAIITELCRPIALEGRSLPVGASLGAAVFPLDGATLDALLKHADEMLYAAKRNGRATKPRRKAA
jgi:diguanylate cyclase (GGDEF)-like protein